MLLTSTLTGDTRASTVTNKTCLICDWTYYYRTIRYQYHLGVPGDTGTSHVHLCKQFTDHVELHTQIVKDLKERDDYDKIQGRESVKRSLQSGEPNE